MATALHGLTIITKTQTRIDVRGQSAEPKLLTKCMGNLAACQFSIMHQITGPSLTVSTACSSGGDAITMGTMLLRSGMADAVVVMAGEAAICPAFLQSLDKVGALSATGESRPFDVTRNGFVTGEGGGALILETESAANVRGAKPLARLLGAANNTRMPTTRSPCAERRRRGGLYPPGAGRRRFDTGGNRLSQCPRHGDREGRHCRGLRHPRRLRRPACYGQLHQGRDRPYDGRRRPDRGHHLCTGHPHRPSSAKPRLTEQDPECPLHLTGPTAVQQPVHAAISNAMGFGGQNSCIVVGRYQE